MAEPAAAWSCAACTFVNEKPLALQCEVRPAVLLAACWPNFINYVLSLDFWDLTGPYNAVSDPVQLM